MPCSLCSNGRNCRVVADLGSVCDSCRPARHHVGAVVPCVECGASLLQASVDGHHGPNCHCTGLDHCAFPTSTSGEARCTNYFVAGNTLTFATGASCRDAIRCMYCGLRPARYMMHNGDLLWCGWCLHTQGQYCESCGIWWAGCCEDCYTCDSCGGRTQNIRVVDGQECCLACSEDAGSCAEHDLYFREECPECRDSSGDGDDGEDVEDHDYRPRPLFHVVKDFGVVVVTKAPSHEVPFGFELEMERNNPRIAVPPFPEALGQLLYCKRDGSLTDGMEVVSHPMTHDAFRVLWPELRGWLAACVEAGWRSHDTETCGLHIHIGRTGMEGGFHLYKLLRLFYEQQVFMFRFSRRKKKHLAQWASFKDASLLDLPRKASRGHLDRETRYCFVNTCNASTVEVRGWRGTLKEDTFRATIEVTLAAVAYTRTVVPDAITLDGFLGYLAKERKTYPAAALAAPRARHGELVTAVRG